MAPLPRAKSAVSPHRVPKIGMLGAFPKELLPPLYGAALVLIAPGGMMLRGSERVAIEDGQFVEVVQARNH